MKSIAPFLFSLFLVATTIKASNDQERRPYIVYMGEVPLGLRPTAMQEHHQNLLTEAIGDVSAARNAKIHSYGNSINGFVARLLPHEADKISGKRGVVSVFPSTMRQLLTTRSWDFLGMPQGLKQRNVQTESNIIVGLLDTGIYIDAPSFSDTGYGPPPSKWKGKCDTGSNFTGCNRKVIGARYYNIGDMDSGMDPSPVDNDGHGSHTASTAAGSQVPGASLYGIARGTARGGAPSARIAMYKVCGSMGCSDTNLLAAFDDAIADGVDVISVSIGGPIQSFFTDVIAIGSFHAFKKGILTVCAAGNDGPDEGTVSNVAPWIFTVAATNVDRGFRTKVKLGNGIKFAGTSLNTFAPKKAMYPLTSSVLAYNSTSPYGNSSSCEMDTLSKSKVKGKIVLCLGNSAADWSIKSIGGIGTIIASEDVTDLATTFMIPTTVVSAKAGTQIGLYVNSTKMARAVIYRSMTVNTTKAPVVASFSSRGPQAIVRNILKPDIAAPGLNILAAYSKMVSITNDPSDNRLSTFNIISGTSMACPHVSGAAAYVKSFHPDWSPAAIKSALMTTAKPVTGSGIENPLDSGSGLLNPVAAVHAGLVYDLTVRDYVRYMCKEGYNSTAIALITGDKSNHFNCSNFKPAQGADGLNYPSMHIQLRPEDKKISSVFHRLVTHVGHGPRVYKAKVISPKGLSVQVVPDTLSFARSKERKYFVVVVKGVVTEATPYTQTAFLEWIGSKHIIRSPILIYRPLS